MDSKTVFPLAVVLAVGLAVAVPVPAQDRAGNQCAALPAAARISLIERVRDRYQSDAAARVLLTDESFVGTTCYRRLIFEIDSGRTSFSLPLYLTPDQRYLTRDLTELRPAAPAASAPTSAAAAQRPVSAPVSLATLTAEAVAVSGSPAAPATIVVFSDFQCPYCKRAADWLRVEMAQRQPDQVRLVFRHFPLDMHPWARPAAEAAACVASQSPAAFWKFHDKIFADQASIKLDNLKDRLTEFARGIREINLAAYQKCVDARQSQGVVGKDESLGKTLRVQGTPTAFLNGNPLPIRTQEQLHADIEAALDPSKKPDPKAAVPVASGASACNPATNGGPVRTEPKALKEGALASVGSPAAPVSVVVFSDFQCPYCKRAAEWLKAEMERRGPNQVQLVYRHFPLVMHSWARPAAEAAACVAAQSPAAFWKFHDKIYADQEIINPENLKYKLLEYALAIGDIDTAAYKKCIDAGQSRSVVENDEKLGNAVQVRATPTLFINGNPFQGLQSPEQLREAIDGALTASKPILASKTK